MSLDIKAEPILEAALAKAGQLAEIYLEETASLVIVLDDDKIEKVLGGADRGAGLRLVHDLRTAYAHTNQADEAGLTPLARNLAALASGPRLARQPPLPQAPGWVAVIARPPQDAATALKIDLVRAANAAARAVDPRVRQVRVTYQERVQRVRVVNSQGVDVNDLRTQVVLAVHCVAADGGVVQTGYETAGGLIGLEIFDQTSPEEVARVAARRAVQMLTARPAPGGAMPVVLHSSAGGTMVHEAVGHGLEADLVLEGMSVYQDRIGQQVASPLITVIDDATLPGRRGSCGFDDEGAPSRRNVLIENGVLKGYLCDRLSALKLGGASSGSGRRESYRFRPIPRMSNTIIAPGDDDALAIIADTPSGLLVKKMGGGQVNTTNGDFVFEVAEGYLIENGRVGQAVRGATLTGNGPAVLMQIDRVAGDLGYSLGTCGKDGQHSPVADAQPTLRIPSMVVGGMHQG
ncbi:MAG: TldD/PmbA family protein [Thermodesulfobacteriota bacterium]